MENNQVHSLKENIAPLALPSKTYGFVGNPIKIYFLNLTEYNSLENITFKVESNGKGTTYADRWEYTPKQTETIDLKITVYDNNGKIINFGSAEIEIKEASQKDNLSVLVLGDSTVNANDETQTLLDLASVDNFNLTLLGTRGSEANKHEGRDGWTSNQYANVEANTLFKNAFYNPQKSKFDFAYYMETQGYSSPDCVVIQLGINDIFLSKTDEELKAEIAKYFNNMEYIIGDIHSYDANIKVVWNLVTPGSTDQSKFEEMYGSLQNADRHKRNTYLANLEIIAKYSDMDNVYIAPINMSLDTVNNMSPGGFGGVHPATAGYTEIGTLLYSFIRAIN